MRDESETNTKKFIAIYSHKRATFNCSIIFTKNQLIVFQIFWQTHKRNTNKPIYLKPCKIITQLSVKPYHKGKSNDYDQTKEKGTRSLKKKQI